MGKRTEDRLDSFKERLNAIEDEQTEIVKILVENQKSYKRITEMLRELLIR